MCDLNELVAELEEFSITVDEIVLVKMKELCMTFDLSAEDLVSSWVAYSTTKGFYGPPTEELLEQLEREELMKLSKTKSQKSRSGKNCGATVYDSSTIDLLDNSYEIPEQHTPERRKGGLMMKSPRVQFSPNSFSPVVSTPSVKYSSRKASGEVVCKHGITENMVWENTITATCSISPFNISTALQNRYTYMFEKFRDYASVLNDMIEEMAADLQKNNEIPKWAHIQLPAMEPVPIIGRICSETGGRLNAQSVLIEGSQETSSGQVMPLDVSQLDKFSFFPGQIIAGEAINSLGKKVIMKSLLKNTIPPFPENCPTFEDSLTIVIAAGPFTTSDSLSYEPLADLMKSVKLYKPHVCILCGPFVDIKHEEIEAGNLPETYQEIFLRLITVIGNSLTEINTKVVLIPSLRDAHHDPVYPVPPYELKQNFKSIYLASDPCLLKIDGVVFGITSTDILLQLGKEEISYQPQSSDRLGRLCEHLLTQKNLYPLYPPPDDVNIDYIHFESHCLLSVTPHVLILPSDLKYFVKDVNGCCCVNPGRLTKGSVGGTFARMKFKSVDPNTYSGSLMQNVQVEIVKI